MTDIIVAFLGLISNIFMFFIPELSLAPELFTNLNSAIATIVDFIEKVNFLIPLPDIFLIIWLDIVIRFMMLVVFGGNWVIRRIFDVIP